MSRSRYGKNIPKLNIKNNETSNFLQLGGSMILGPKFDIKQYLNNINTQQFSAKKEIDNLPPLFDNLYPRSKNDNKKYELSTIVNNHLQNHRKIQNGVKSPSFVSTNRNYKNNNITMVNNKNTINYYYFLFFFVFIAFSYFFFVFSFNFFLIFYLTFFIYFSFK